MTAAIAASASESTFLDGSLLLLAVKVLEFVQVGEPRAKFLVEETFRMSTRSLMMGSSP